MSDRMRVMLESTARFSVNGRKKNYGRRRAVRIFCRVLLLVDMKVVRLNRFSSSISDDNAKKSLAYASTGVLNRRSRCKKMVTCN